MEDILGQDRKHIAGFWATQEEVKMVLKEVHEIDEQKVIKYLADGKSQKRSQSIQMCHNWNLDRKRIRKILASMADDRTLQTTFGNLMGATRFKASGKGKIWHTVCPKCKTEIDSWEHCVKCYQIQAKEVKNEKQWLANIRDITEKIKTATPAKYTTSNIQHTQYTDREENKTSG